VLLRTAASVARRRWISKFGVPTALWVATEEARGRSTDNAAAPVVVTPADEEAKSLSTARMGVAVWDCAATEVIRLPRNKATFGVELVRATAVASWRRTASVGGGI